MVYRNIVTWPVWTATQEQRISTLRSLEKPTKTLSHLVFENGVWSFGETITHLLGASQVALAAKNLPTKAGEARDTGKIPRME